MTKEENQFIEIHSELGTELLKRYSLEKAIEAMENYYQGEFYNREDFARSHMLDRADKLPEEYKSARHIVANWLNWEHIAWELFVNDFKDIRVGNTIHVFQSF